MKKGKFTMPNHRKPMAADIPEITLNCDQLGAAIALGILSLCGVYALGKKKATKRLLSTMLRSNDVSKFNAPEENEFVRSTSVIKSSVKPTSVKLSGTNV